MKKIFSLLIISICSIVAFAQEQTDSLITPFCISDGYFFSKENFGYVMPGGSTMAIFRDPDGNKLMGVYLPDGFALDETIIAQAIPAERVRHAQKLLHDYNGRRPSVLNKYEGIGVEVGKPFITFNYKDTDNNIWNNQSVAGKVYVINVWQSECGPCRGEMPILSTWKETFPDVVFLSASRHNTEEILPIVQRHNFTWTHLQEASDIVALVGQQGFPLTVVVDRNGIVRFAKVGASEENQAEAFNTIHELSKSRQDALCDSTEQEHQIIDFLQLFYADFVFGNKNISNIEENLSQEVLNKMKAAYLYDCETDDCYALWIFRSGEQDGLSDKQSVTDITHIHEDQYCVSYDDMGHKGKCSFSVKLINGKVVIEDFKSGLE